EIPQVAGHGKGKMRIVAFPETGTGTTIVDPEAHFRAPFAELAPRVSKRMAQATRLPASSASRSRESRNARTHEYELRTNTTSVSHCCSLRQSCVEAERRAQLEYFARARTHARHSV